MKEVITSKRRNRLENKKKKMAALLDIAKLNEYDRVANLKKKQEEQHETINTQIETEQPIRKRLKTDSEDKPPLLGPSEKPILSGEDYIQLKKMLRERTNKIRHKAKLRLREMGENASLQLEIENRVPLFLSDLQHLILYSQLGAHSPYSPARWCALEKYNKLVNTNVLIIENVSLYNYTSNESIFEFLSTFDYKLEMIAPCAYKSDIIRDLSMVPLTSTQTRKLIMDYRDLNVAAAKSDEIFDTVRNFFPIDSTDRVSVDSSDLPQCDHFSRTQLLLSGWQLVEENFPLPIKGLMERKYSGYLLTKDKYKDVTPKSPMFAVDCEMCRTTTGDLELTRVSIVDENHKVFYDTLVKPDNKIVDYLTRFSGINAKMMRNVTKKLSDVQKELRELLPEDAILIGQSLSNDMHALKMMHPYVIDTSIIFNLTGDRSRKTKLQTLAREFLSEKIQESKKGHCSTEDSLACMKLTQLKLQKHYAFGDAVLGGTYNEHRAYPEMGTAQFAKSMLRQCTKKDKTAHVIAQPEIVEKYKYYVTKGSEVPKRISFSAEQSDKDVVDAMCRNLVNNSLNIAHLRVATPSIHGGDVQLLQDIDKAVAKLFNESPQSSLVIVLLSGNKDGGTGLCLMKIKQEYIV